MPPGKDWLPALLSFPGFTSRKRFLIASTFLISTLVLLLFSNPVFAAEKTILILGDSLTAGYGVEKHEAFPKLLEDRLRDHGFTKVKIINGGFSGSTTASAYQRIRWYMRLKPDMVILELGANDGLRGHKIDTIKSNLEKTIQFTLERKIVTVLAGMKLPINYGRNYTLEFEELYKSLSDQYSLPLIPFLLEGVAGRPELNLADGIHPNPKGHKIIAENVLAQIRPLLTDSQ
jgi:acyl-CoA thioesterase-1